ncbi:unnamed protein product [Camellia sinensis]
MAKSPREHIEEIRKKKFKIGEEPDPKNEDLHHAVNYLSAELCQRCSLSHGTHSVWRRGTTITEFVITSRDITAIGASATLLVFNNERGFPPKNVESICSIGHSTKKGHRKRGYIGKKGMLEDILYITGFPVDGRPITGRDDSDPAQICQTYLGLSNILRVIKKGKENAPDPAGAQVSVLFLPLLENVNEIKNYPWGPAMLSYMHFSMARLKDNLHPKKEIAGCFYALMIRDAIAEFPLIVQWSNILRRITRDNWNHHLMNNFVQCFENLGGNEIIWKPYERLPVDFLPLPLRGQAIIGMSRTILICFEKAVYHWPDLCPRQFGLEEDFQCTLTDRLVEIRTISWGGPKINRDWSKFGEYHWFNQEWERRHALLINYQLMGPILPLLKSPNKPAFYNIHCLQHLYIMKQASPSEHPPPSTFVYNEGEESLFPMDWDSTLNFSLESGNFLGTFAGEGGLDDVATGSTTPNSTAATVGDTQHNSPPPPTPNPTGVSRFNEA